MKRLIASAIVVTFLLIIGSEWVVEAQEEGMEPTPELISLCCTGIRWNSDETPPHETKVFSLQPEVSLSFGSGTCCNLLENSVRVSITGCLAPDKTGFKRGDTGVEYIDDEIDAQDKIIVDLEEVGCTLPADSTIDVVIYAESNTATGKVSGAYPWTFETGPAPPSQSGPTPAPPTKPTNPPPKIFNVSPTSGLVGNLIEINGVSFRSGSQVSLNYLNINATYVNPNKMTFTVPAGTECGTLPVQIINPDTSSNLGKYSEVVEFTVNCKNTIAPSPPSRTIINPQIDNFFPGGGSPGSNIIVNGQDFTSNSVIYFDGEALNTEYIFGTQLRFSVPTGAPCGEVNIYLKEGLLQSDSKTFTVTQPCGQKTIVNPPGSPPPTDPPPAENPPPDDSPPPPIITGTDLEDYDLNGDCMINDIEFFGLLDAWLSESTDDSTFFAGVDAWIGDLNICSASTNSSMISLQMSSVGLLITSVNQRLGSVQIFDKNGKVVFSQNTQSNQMHWNLRNSMGTPIGNGVYFVRIGSLVEFKKIVVMR